MGSEATAPRKRQRGKPGRPGHLTAEVRERFIEQLKKGVSVVHAARLAGLNGMLVEQWIARGRGKNPDRPATPEYVALAEAVDNARSGLIGELVVTVLDGAKKDPILALKLMDRLDPNWMQAIRIAAPDADDPDDAPHLAPRAILPGGATALLDDPAEEPVTLHERIITIPASRIEEFSRLVRGKDGDADARLSRFRETAGDLPTG